MDGNRFDDLARGLAAARSRRGVLKGLAGAALAAIGLDRLDGAAEARAVCRDEGHSCEGNQTCCAGLACVASGRSKARRCARPATTSACPDGQISCGGACIPACAASDQCHVAGVCDPAAQACTNPAKPNGAPCDDGNACTQTDTCQAGICVGGNPVVCAASDECHVAGECNPASGRCSNPDAPDGTTCNDGNACTTGDHCRSGRCVGGAAVACEASGPCKTASCDPAQGCVESNKSAGVACADDNACNGTEHCDGDGNCAVGQPVSCGPCLICDSASGSCKPDPAQIGHACPGDGDKCRGDFQCTASGACAATTAVTCQPLDQCHVAGTCDPATGVCDNPNAADGAACEDGNLCTTGDACQAGVCTGGDPVTCDVPHGLARCDARTGKCAWVACDGGYRDCNADMSDGCETHTMTDVNNCGACGHACPSTHGTPACHYGTCFITCDEGYANCDNSQTSGCATNLKTSTFHCGACGNYCVWGGHCVDGTCFTTCANGVKDGNETGVDCGGGTCHACPNGETCLSNRDCDTNTCHNGVCADRVCKENEVSYLGHCYYLDGSGGKCDPGYRMDSDSILVALRGQFVGLTYKHQVSTDCCIQSTFPWENFGMGNHCNLPGPFDETDVVRGASGCTNKQNATPGQLTICGSI